ncbi:MAG TPA: VWA domain-containing protein, partial [Trebonia sp.]|nr:VWA domain-containing protein [Trebonia sp.]
LRTAGLPAGPGRSERLAGALTVMRATTIDELHACALATMVSGPNQIDAFERVFNEMFGSGPAAMRGPEVTAPQQNMLVESAERADDAEAASPDPADAGELPPELAGLEEALSAGEAREQEAEPDAADDSDEGMPAVRRVASRTERLRERDFAQLSPAELAQLASLMRELVIAVPPRRTRRYRPKKDGARLDMRRTMRQATRTGGEPVRIARRAVRTRPRRLIVLCDISGSMEPYARAILQLMYVASRSSGATGGGGPGFSGPSRDATRPRTEVFTFATRLTRLTPYLAAATPETMLARAGEAAPDWAGGTRIGAALHEFNDRYAVRGMGRGAVILIISDGWETGEPAVLGAQMARLHRIAYRIVWANPRTQSERYRPEVGGMAAAWPYCDAVVSAHNFEALDDLLEALRTPRVHRPSYVPRLAGDAPGDGPGGDGTAGDGTGGGPAAAAPVPAGGMPVSAPRTQPQPPPLSLPITQDLGRRWSP